MDCDFSPSSPHLLPNGLFSPQNRISFELLALSGLSGFSTFKGGKMLIFQGFANSRIVREFPPFSFKVRIATLTRNQVVLTGSWVRIPPAPPSKNPVTMQVSGFFFFVLTSKITRFSAVLSMIFGKNSFLLYSPLFSAFCSHLLPKSPASGRGIPLTIACAEESFEL